MSCHRDAAQKKFLSATCARANQVTSRTRSHVNAFSTKKVATRHVFTTALPLR